MEDTKHTPGPWKAIKNGSPRLPSDINYWGISAGRGCFIHGEPSAGFKITGFISTENAHLIAAAPELLHAAKSALETLSQPAIFPQDIEAVRKMLSEVIKKSETV